MLFRLSEIAKSYGGHQILRGISFQINPGEKVGLVGRNGTGKTTLFRIITGAESPDAGDVHKINNLKIGLLEQHVDFGGDESVHTAALSAFKNVQDIESEMRRLEKQMETDASDTVLQRYAEMQTRYERADGFTYAARAEAVLMGLGFSRESWSADAASLSGGQKNRLGMARLLLSSPDILLLDEPTNHLDVQAVEWLETFLQTYAGSYVVISHDRYFLDRTTNRIIEIDNGKAVTYKGNYSDYLVEREFRREQQQRAYENQQALIAKTEEFIRRNIEGQKTKQAKSRRNMLERIDRLDAVTSERHGGSFGLKKVERAGNNVLMTERLSIGYGRRALAKSIDLTLHRGEALGIVGGNGTGKTTFLKTILGDIAALDGKIFWGTKVDIGYYSQNLEDLVPQNEVIQELRRVAPLADGGELRSFLARFLFFGEDVFKRVADLSGGEKGRLALAKLIYSRKNVLVLDEPTNHLDIPAREALEAALDEYDGTIITVSHDRFFLDRVATQILAFSETGEVETFKGNYTEYHEWREHRIRSAQIEARSERENGSAFPDMVKSESDHLSVVVTATAQNGAGLSKNQRARLESRISEIENRISELEDEAAKLAVELSSPVVASDFDRLSALTKRLNETEAEIQKLYAEWDECTAALE